MKSRRSDSLSIFLSFTLRKTTTMAENDFEVVKRQLEVINPHQRGLPGAPEVEEAADVAPRAVPPTVAVPADGDDVAADADDNDAAASVSAASSEGRAAEMILNPEADENLECQNELWLWQEHTRQQQARQQQQQQQLVGGGGGLESLCLKETSVSARGAKLLLQPGSATSKSLRSLDLSRCPNLGGDALDLHPRVGVVRQCPAPTSWLDAQPMHMPRSM